jgi:pilus assembly protein CpaE
LQQSGIEPRSFKKVSTNYSPNLVNTTPEMIGVKSLSVALIGPGEERRHAASQVIGGCGCSGIQEFSSYPPSLDDVPRILEAHYDVIVIDLDSDLEFALDLVESIGSNGVATVMVYSSSTDPGILMRCMRAGAREFLTVPFSSEVVAEALVRAAARRPAQQTGQAEEKRAGRLLVFMGAKGGSGVTTLACNFATALAQAPQQKTLLIDLDLPLGDAALDLGISAEFSAIDALQSAERLDAKLLSQLLTKHSSGLMVLAAPG